MDTAAVWTAIGLVAAFSMGTLFYVGSRVDALAARLDARIDSLTARIDAFEGRVESRFDNLEARLDIHLERHAATES